MRRDQFDGRRFGLRVLLGIGVVFWGACLSRADDKPTAAQGQPADYVSDTIGFGGKSICLWRFDPKAAEKQPAILFLHGADGGIGAEKMYCTAAKQLAGKGYVVFIVHYLDATKPEEPARISAMVKRVVREKATKCEEARVRKYFDVWTSCVSEVVGYVRKQHGVDGERVGILGLSLGGFVGLSVAAQKELNIAAVVSGFGGLPKERRDSVKWLPPTLIVHGDEDEVVPVHHAVALRKLGRAKKLPIEVKIYEGVGHVFQLEDGKFDMKALMDAQRRMIEHFNKHLKAPIRDKVAIRNSAGAKD